MRVKVPLHVSGLWIPFKSENPLETGSYGAGLNLDLYMEAEATAGDCGIRVNNETVLRDQSLEICSGGPGVSVGAYSPVSLGSGFGLSAGLLIAHALAAYRAKGLPSLRAFQVAHVLEVKYSTGLGDVLSEYTGGFAIRLKPGAPGVGVAHRVMLPENPVLVVGELPYREPTHMMLSRISSSLYSEAFSYYRRIVETEDLHEFFTYSQAFTRRIFDYSTVDKVLQGVKGVVSFYLKKAALVIWVEDEYALEVSELLGSKGVKVFTTRVSSRGVTVEYSTKSPAKREPANQGETG
ncbi:pantoate kinase [Desulfurococcus mucosus]|uniref:Pantoate kinase n=1 Tax=Desulfurococcus mucosus (strain ATCC 35584 / DSM 2162 / JCM 9187 / O7/1) TaxID=765177 RepID=E8R973_DESM0|nr:kinase [Desulfurococcus mucosus]ADV65049.1 GHMP kinase [Desulfurococcus mucosus DSM 2162]